MGDVSSEESKDESLNPVVDKVYDRLLNDAERVRQKHEVQH